MKEQTALLFLLKLLILECVLKSIFFIYNYNISNGWSMEGIKDTGLVIKWFLCYDGIIILLINLPLLLIVLIAGKFLQNKYFSIAVTIPFVFLNTFSLFLNSFDIFYYRFHLQRADSDLLYVLRNPLTNGTINVLLIALAMLIFCFATGWLIYKNITKIIKGISVSNRYLLSTVLLLKLGSLFFLTGTKKLLPTYPLTQLKPVQLPLVQNSVHTFIYSMYRRNERLYPV